MSLLTLSSWGCGRFSFFLYSRFLFLILCTASLIFALEEWALPPRDFSFNLLLLEQGSSGTDGRPGWWWWGCRVVTGEASLQSGLLGPSSPLWPKLKGKPLYGRKGPSRPLTSPLST